MSYQLSPTAKKALLTTAAMAVVEHQVTSCVFLQMELSINSDQATQVLAELEAAGIVGPYDTNIDMRAILVHNINDLEEILNATNETY